MAEGRLVGAALVPPITTKEEPRRDVQLLIEKRMLHFNNDLSVPDLQKLEKNRDEIEHTIKLSKLNQGKKLIESVSNEEAKKTSPQTKDQS